MNPLPVILALATSQPTTSASAASAFQQLAGLAGTWRVADRPQSPLSIRFSTTAGGTVVVESWAREGRPHSLTLYHLDGAHLIATHYCPQGNQPRIALADKGPGLRFAFVDATDLDAKHESYLHDLAFDLTDPTRPVRSETYRSSRGDEPSRLTLVRDR